MAPLAVQRAGGRPRLRPQQAAAAAVAAARSHLGVSWKAPPVCIFWLRGQCTHRPCRFLHQQDLRHPPSLSAMAQVSNRQTHPNQKNVWRRPSFSEDAAFSSPPGNGDESRAIFGDGGIKNRNKSASWVRGDDNPWVPPVPPAPGRVIDGDAGGKGDHQDKRDLEKKGAEDATGSSSPPGKGDGSRTVSGDGGIKNKNRSAAWAGGDGNLSSLVPPAPGLIIEGDAGGKGGQEDKGILEKQRAKGPPGNGEESRRVSGDGGIENKHRSESRTVSGYVGIKNKNMVLSSLVPPAQGPVMDGDAGGNGDKGILEKQRAKGPPPPPASPAPGLGIDGGGGGCRKRKMNSADGAEKKACRADTYGDAGGDDEGENREIHHKRRREGPPLPPASPAGNLLVVCGGVGGVAAQRGGDGTVVGPSPSFYLLTALQGHQNAITGIIIHAHVPSKIFSGSCDGTIRVWDTITWQCVQVIELGVPVSCLVRECRFIFAGALGGVHGCHVQTRAGVNLPVSARQVRSLEMSIPDNTLFAGVEDGTVLAWKASVDDDGCCSVFGSAPAAMLGHTSAVLSLVLAGGRLYSGSTDCTIRAWDIGTLHCDFTVSGHTHAVTALLCWHQFLLSGSLDGTIRVWRSEGDGSSGLVEIHRHQEEHGVLVLAGMGDPAGMPVLMCSVVGDGVRLYDLPSFAGRGVIRSKGEVTAIHVGSDGGLFFTGDATGELRAWRWSSPPKHQNPPRLEEEASCSSSQKFVPSFFVFLRAVEDLVIIFALRFYVRFYYRNTADTDSIADDIYKTRYYNRNIYTFAAHTILIL